MHNAVRVVGRLARTRVGTRDGARRRSMERDCVGTVRRSLTHVTTTRGWGFYRASPRLTAAK